jgi:PleD family two-component response regulator
VSKQSSLSPFCLSNTSCNQNEVQSDGKKACKLCRWLPKSCAKRRVDCHVLLSHRACTVSGLAFRAQSSSRICSKQLLPNHLDSRQPSEVNAKTILQQQHSQASACCTGAIEQEAQRSSTRGQQRKHTAPPKILSKQHHAECSAVTATVMRCCSVQTSQRTISHTACLSPFACGKRSW